MSPTGTPRIGAPRSPDQIEQERLEAQLDNERAEHETPISLNPRVKPAPKPEPVHVAQAQEPLVSESKDRIASAERQYAKAEEALSTATVGFADAERELAQAKIDHAAVQAARMTHQHREILTAALARARRHQAAFQTLFDNYGGVGKHGLSRGILATYAKTIPSGDARRREPLIALYREAGVLMETIRLGFQAAFRAVEATSAALDRVSASESSEFRVEQAGIACEEACAHDPVAVEAACKQLIADVKAVDGVPGEEIVVYLDSPDRAAVREQEYATGTTLGNPSIPR